MRWSSACGSKSLQIYAAALLRTSSNFVSVPRRTGCHLHANSAVSTMAAKGPYQEQLLAACDAVRLAAILCQRVQQQLKEGESASKDDASPVTVADYGAQALVTRSLLDAGGADEFSLVAEEDSTDLRLPEGKAMTERITHLVNETLSDKGQSSIKEQGLLELIDKGKSEGGSQGRHWVLDPIDGTRGFLGQRQYAICLGLIDKGEAVVGVLACPNLPQNPIVDADGEAGASLRASDSNVGCLFAAQKGGGAFIGPLRGDGIPDQLLALEDIQDSSNVRFMESFEAAHSNHELTLQIAKKLGVTKPPLRIDSQAKYGALARGDAAINLRFPRPGYREKIWDHAAGYVIVTEAGATITDAAGNPLDFGKSRWLDLHKGIITSTKTLHSAILEAVREIADAEKAG